MKITFRINCYVVLLLTMLLGHVTCAQIYSYKIYNHKQGLPLNSTYALLEKKDGGILVGTLGAGIVENNGFSIQEVTHSKNFFQHHVTGITEVNGTTYFTSQYQGVFYVDENKEIQRINLGHLEGEYLDIANYNNYLIVISNQFIVTVDLATKKIVDKFIDKLQHTANQHFTSPKGTIILTNIKPLIVSSKGKIETLQDALGIHDQSLHLYKYGYYKNNQIVLYPSNLSHKATITLSSSNSVLTKEKLYGEIPIVENQFLATFNPQKGCISFLTQDGTVLEEVNNKIVALPNNSPNKNMILCKFICDYTGTYWASTAYSGLLRISQEPFTALHYAPELKTNKISFIKKGDDDKIMFSYTNDNVTFTGDLFKGAFKTHPIKLHSWTNFEGKKLFGTANGVMEYHESGDKFTPFHLKGIAANARINYIREHGNYLWVAQYNNGVFQYDKNFNLIHHFLYETKAPTIVYTSQYFEDGNYILWGTPIGIKKLHINSRKFTELTDLDLGLYCGSSAKDVFGTSWFAMEKGLIGMTKRGEKVIISDKSLFNSYLFYTINCDSYGNIIIGTNKGFNILKVNEKGIVLSQRSFGSNEDFEGFEPNYNSNHQVGDEIFVGTAEGMYMVSLTNLHNLIPPQAPKLNLLSYQPDTRYHDFLISTKNIRFKNLLYTYRIKGHNQKWSTPSTYNHIIFENFPSGSYEIEAKVSYDGINFSDIGNYKLEIHAPPLRGYLYWLAIIPVIVGLLIYFDRKTKKDAQARLFNTEEPFLTRKYTASFILFGIFAQLLYNELGYLIDNSVKQYHLLVTLTCVVMYTFYLRMKRDRLTIDQSQLNLQMAFYSLIIMFLYFLHDSNLHPFYCFGLLITSVNAAFIIPKPKHVIIYTISFLIASALAIFTADAIHYDKLLMLTPIIVTAMLSLFHSLLIQDSINHFTIISRITSETNLLTIVVNRDIQVKFISANVQQILGVNPYSFIGKPLSIINQYIPENLELKGLDLSKGFYDGLKFTCPLMGDEKEIRWFEFTCKEISHDLRILMGQEITEKITIQNTHETLIQNIQDLIIKTDVTGKIQFINSRLNEYLGFDTSELLNQNIATVGAMESKDAIEQHIQSQIKSNTSFSSFEWILNSKKDDKLLFDLNITLLYETGDESIPTGILFVGRNVTEKKRTEQLIASQNSDIKSSIGYTLKLQELLMQNENYINTYFEESFIIFQPKDIVSGDFYYVGKVEHHTIIAVGDGTGHGVPGAFMSTLGYNILATIIKEKQFVDAGRILDEMDFMLTNTLDKTHSNQYNDDEIELSLCVINEETGNFNYACAGSRFMIHNEDGFQLYKGDSKLLGVKQEKFQNYVTNHGKLEDDATIYMFTDGYYQQYGGAMDKKFSIKRLFELFTQNIRLPLVNQKEMILDELRNWMKNTPQTDDITVLGVKRKQRR